MKYICFGYLDTQRWSQLSPEQQTAAIDACFAYDDELKKNGHWAGGEGLQGPDKAVVLRDHKGKVTITDGPFTETKEVLGGLLILEAPDFNQAIQLLSNHPGMKMGPWEIRPVEDMTAMLQESARRRSANQ